MAEGVSRSVIAKQEQTISEENSPLIVLKLSFIPRCASKNLGVVLRELLPEQNRTQVEIFSLSPGSDIMCATCMFEKPKQRERVFGNAATFFTSQSLRSAEAAHRYDARGVDGVHLCDRLHLVCPHPTPRTHTNTVVRPMYVMTMRRTMLSDVPIKVSDVGCPSLAL